MSQLKGIVFSTLLVLGQNVMATDASHTQAALKLLEVTNSHNLTEEMITEVKQRLDELSISEALNSQQTDLFEKFQRDMRALIDTRLKWDTLKIEYAAIYTRTYSESELTQLTTFYQTELGQKLLSNAGSVSHAFAQIPQRHMDELIPEMQIAAQQVMQAINDQAQSPDEAERSVED